MPDFLWYLLAAGCAYLAVYQARVAAMMIEHAAGNRVTINFLDFLTGNSERRRELEEKIEYLELRESVLSDEYDYYTRDWRHLL